MRYFIWSILYVCSFALNAQSFQWNNEQTAQQTPKSVTQEQSNRGLAHIYPDYYENVATAFGEIFSQSQMTAGHATLPLGTMVKVTRLDNGTSAVVRINDQGAFCDGCVIDITKTAANQLGIHAKEQVQVELMVLGDSDINPPVSSRANTLTAKGMPTDYEARAHTSTTRATAPSSPPALPEAEATYELETVSTPAQKLCATADVDINKVRILDVPASPFVVQLGAYFKYSNAERHVLKLQKQGFTNVFVLEEQVPGDQPLNRVVVMPFEGLVEAKAYVAELKALHAIDALIFQMNMVEFQP